MPKTNVDYNKTVIYKIFCDDDNITEIYIGSTTDYTRRKSEHKSSCNNTKRRRYNQKLYKTIRDNGGWENFRMIEIEKYPCNDKREAECREEYWRKNLKAELNSIRCWIDPVCKEEGCKNIATSPTDYCIKHGGGIRCLETDCKSSAIHPTHYCVKHGGGKPCIYKNCETSARNTSGYCVKHGGGKRCLDPDCKSSAIPSSDYCKKHGGGKRCIYIDCDKSAISTTDYCAKHGEQYTCECGSTLSIKGKNRHDKSKKHQKYLDSL